jgi:transcriptional regulator with XRE-family HTH domain
VRRASRGLRELRVFGDRIRAYRLKRDLCQEDLGELAGLHRTYIGHLERGEVNPSLVNVLKVATALEVDAAALVKGLTKGVGDPRTV